MSLFKLFVIVNLVLINHCVSAKTITGTIHFDSKPAYIGIFYAKDQIVSDQPLLIDQVDKKFVAKMFVKSSMGNTIFQNSDSIDHNIYANSSEVGAKFNVGLIAPGDEVKIDSSAWNAHSVLRLGCKIHPKMKTFIANIGSRNYQILEFEKKIYDYQVKLEQIAPETSFVTLWLPRYDEISINLTNKNKGSQHIELIKKGKVRGYIEVLIAD